VNGPLLLRTDEGKRRCQSVSPTHGVQCEKKRKHVRKDEQIVHKAGALIWGHDTPTVTFQEVRTYLDAPATSKLLGHVPTFVALDETSGFSPFKKETAGLLDEGDVDNTPENELRDWWYKVAHDEVLRTVPKAVEYGSTDLLDIGTMLARTLRRNVTEEEAAELGVFFYLIGKVARWQSAIERGERPSDDTLFDIGVYVRMAQRIRHSGGWPGTEEK